MEESCIIGFFIWSKAWSLFMFSIFVHNGKIKLEVGGSIVGLLLFVVSELSHVAGC